MKDLPIKDFGWNVSDPEKLAKSAGLEIIRFIGGQIAKDFENRYSLLSDWHLPKTQCDFWGNAPVYESELFRIEPIKDSTGFVRPVIKAYISTKEKNVCDGATFSPDTPKGVIEAAIMHDPAYYKGEDGLTEYERIAKHCGVDPEVVRKWFDELFPTIVIAAGGKPWVAKAYYRGIRTGYPIFNFFRPFLKFLGVVLACALVSSGCMDFNYLFDTDEPYVPPVVEKVEVT